MKIDRQPYPASCHSPEPRADFTSTAYDRWAFQLDMNCDGAFAASDAWLMVKYAFFAPGDFVLMASAATTLGTPFDLSNLTLGGGASLVMSVVVWVIIFVLLGVFFEWLDACLKKVGEWTDTFGAWTDR